MPREGIRNYCGRREFAQFARSSLSDASLAKGESAKGVALTPRVVGLCGGRVRSRATNDKLGSIRILIPASYGD